MLHVFNLSCLVIDFVQNCAMLPSKFQGNLSSIHFPHNLYFLTEWDGSCQKYLFCDREKCVEFCPSRKVSIYTYESSGVLMLLPFKNWCIHKNITRLNEAPTTVKAETDLVTEQKKVIINNYNFTEWLTWIIVKRPRLTCRCYMIVFLVQWFGFISHSPSEAINCEAYFVSQGIGTLLKMHKQHLYVRKSKNTRKIKRGERKSPAFLPRRRPWPHPRCPRVLQRSGPVCTSSLNCRWPPVILLGSLPVSLHPLWLSPCGPKPAKTTNTATSTGYSHMIMSETPKKLSAYVLNKGMFTCRYSLGLIMIFIFG